MGVAVSRFTSAVLTGGLVHDGDPRLARHVGHVVARETAEGMLLGKDAKASPRRIDAAIAGVVAHERAVWHAANPRRGGRADGRLARMRLAR